MFLLLGCLSLYAADNDLITKQITIELEKAGTLPDRISSSKMYKITNLKIIGEINGTDLSMIREMAGGNYSDGKLSVLDLSEAKIVEGGDSYYVNDLHNYYSTSNDVIGSFAFQGCRRLTSLTLPAGITSICEGAFWGCRELTSLTLPAGITWIEFSAFDGCSGLKEVRFCINDNLDTYLTKGQTPWSVLMGKQPTVANPYKKVNCGIKYYINDKEITSIEIPSNVTTLSNYVFQGCSGLTSLTLPAGITEIGDYAFWGCSGLTSLNLPAGITKIGDYAFGSCRGLTSLTLPAGITEIGKGAFDYCSGLTSLNLPAGITKIGDGAFRGCSGLTSIYVYAEKVPEKGYRYDVFERVDAKKCTLYVPMGTYDDYRLSYFGHYFENIVEFDATGIDKTTTSTDVEEVARYSVNGQRLSAPTKGLNIVKYSDGSVKKVAVQ